MIRKRSKDPILGVSEYALLALAYNTQKGCRSYSIVRRLKEAWKISAEEDESLDEEARGP